MAAVTINIQSPRQVVGSLVARVYDISGVTGSTLTVPQGDVFFVNNQTGTSAGIATTITAFAVSSSTVSPVETTITFTSSGPMVHEVILVASRVG
jgi:hypothetical protein